MKIDYIILILLLISVFIVSRLGDLPAMLGIGFSGVIIFLSRILMELKE